MRVAYGVAAACGPILTFPVNGEGTCTAGGYAGNNPLLFLSWDWWTQWRGAGALAGVHGGVTALALDPTTPSTVYAGTQTLDMFKSKD